MQSVIISLQQQHQLVVALQYNNNKQKLLIYFFINFIKATFIVYYTKRKIHLTKLNINFDKKEPFLWLRQQ